MNTKVQYQLMMTGLLFAYGMAAQYLQVPAFLLGTVILAMAILHLHKDMILPAIIGTAIMEGYLLVCHLFFKEPVFILLEADAVLVSVRYAARQESCMKTSLYLCAFYAVMRIIAMAVLVPSCTSILDLLFMPVAAGTAKQLLFAKRRHDRRRTTGVEYQL
ncbi:MAG: hypothetical protein SOI44_00055 [Lactimicrobium sp.]|jgi:hypothetical protein|uniref:hypothetical protein n=1 Tax=Lactimicrobium sp. TaxID=2563780 RepID=UPI002F34F4ED